MPIQCLGIDYKNTPIDLREKLAFNEDQIRMALSRVSCGCDGPQAGGFIQEMVILSTCNRTELYAVSALTAFNELEAFLADSCRSALGEGNNFESLRPHLRHLDESETIRHLFAVACGLESQVLGEPQILGQVTHALELARGVGAAGPLLSRLFQTAIYVGKRAHTETQISQNPTSISSLAARLCERSVTNLESAQVVIVGAGDMAELAVEALRKRGVQRLLVLNRTLERARLLADRWQAACDTFENLEQALQSADILIASTSAPHLVIQAGMVARAMSARGSRPLVLVDIAVPRDIDPEVCELPHVRLYDIDQLSAQLEGSLAERSSQIPLVEAILAEETGRFLRFLDSLDMLPLIAGLRQQAEDLRQAELQKTLRHMPDLTNEEIARIDAFSRALVKKLLHAPTRRLRAESNCPHAPQYVTVAQTLFDLPNQGELCHFSGGACSLALEDLDRAQ
jgi:glutamyl-tRNA reductase